jgi:hypothetical protein
VYAFEPRERFVAGTVGPPGERMFFLLAAAVAGWVSSSRLSLRSQAPVSNRAGRRYEGRLDSQRPPAKATVDGVEA